MDKKKISQARSTKVSAATRAAGISAMSKALGYKVGTTKTPQHNVRKANKVR